MADEEKTGHEGFAILALAVIQQLVDEALAATAAMHQDVFEIDQAVEVQS